MFNVLIAEDDSNTLKWISAILTREGYNAITAADGNTALEKAASNHIDLIVLDVMMPERDGYSVAEEFRKTNKETPILMVSAKALPADRCRGLVTGADDYMTKPIYEQEFLLRIKALLRRAQIVSERRLVIGQTVLDYDRLTVTCSGEMQTLPKKEFYLIFKLLSYPGKIFTRIQLMDEIWGLDNESSDATITVHINRLRKKFALCRDFEIVAIRGIGYKAVIYNEKKQ